jgi:vacuolar-type H+-ATPase subunit I/STV1
MSQEEKSDKKQSADKFAEMFRAFGQAVGEVFDDPELKRKAKEFADSATDLRTRMSKLNSETWEKQLKNSARVSQISSRQRRKNNSGGSDWI